jgi:hypothetical protein
VLGGGQVFLATAQWAAPDSRGNTLYTAVRVLDGLVFDEFGDAHFGQGTSIDLNRYTLDANGNSIFSNNDFFGSTFTTTPVFTADKGLKTATLAPVNVNDCVYDEVGNCAVVLKHETIATSWTGTGTLATTRTTFRESGGVRHDRYRVQLDRDVESRPASAIGSLSGRSPGESVPNTGLFSTSSVSITTGNIGGTIISHPDYDAPIVDLGNKTIRGGTGTVGAASWILTNRDGSTVQYFLSVDDGFGFAGRILVFFDGTFVSLFKLVRDPVGNPIEEKFGFIDSSSNLLDAKKNLSSATVAPLGLAICAFEDRDESFNCMHPELVTLRASWTGTGQLFKGSTFRFTAVTNCADPQCSTADRRRQFKATASGSGQARNAIANATINGFDLGPSITEPVEDAAFLATLSRSTIEFRGAYPLQIYPLQFFP